MPVWTEATFEALHRRLTLNQTEGTQVMFKIPGTNYMTQVILGSPDEMRWWNFLRQAVGLPDLTTPFRYTPEPEWRKTANAKTQAEVVTAHLNSGSPVLAAQAKQLVADLAKTGKPVRFDLLGPTASPPAAPLVPERPVPTPAAPTPAAPVLTPSGTVVVPRVPDSPVPPPVVPPGPPAPPINVPAPAVPSASTPSGAPGWLDQQVIPGVANKWLAAGAAGLALLFLLKD